MTCFPLDNTEYTAKALGAWLGTRTRGVFSADENLAVSAGTGMTVTVSTGLAWLKMAEYWGLVFLLENAQTLTVDTADGALNRIDAVVVRIDKNENQAEVVIKQGAYALQPVVAPPERDLNYDEIYLATISVPAGTVEITSDLITDQRLNEEYCGLMRDGVTGIPTEQLQTQAQTLINNLQEELAAVEQGSAYMLSSLYSPDATAEMTDNVLTVTSTASRTNTTYPVNITIPEGYTVSSTLSLDGTTVTVTNLQGEATPLNAAVGVTVSCLRVGAQLFPLSGNLNPASEVGTGTIDDFTPANTQKLIFIRK